MKPWTEMRFFGALEAVKTVADLFMPLSGTIEELNPLLEDEPQKSMKIRTEKAGSSKSA